AAQGCIIDRGVAVNDDRIVDGSAAGLGIIVYGQLIHRTAAFKLERLIAAFRGDLPYAGNISIKGRKRAQLDIRAAFAGQRRLQAVDYVPRRNGVILQIEHDLAAAALSAAIDLQQSTVVFHQPGTTADDD